MKDLQSTTVSGNSGGSSKAAAASAKADAAGVQPAFGSVNTTTPPPATVFTAVTMYSVTGYNSSGQPVAVSVPAGGTTSAIQVAGTGGASGVPNGSEASALSLLMLTGAVTGSLSVFPAGQTYSGSSQDEFAYPANQYASISVVSELSSGGAVVVHNSGSKAIVLDVLAEGYYTPSGNDAGFIPLDGERVLWTPNGEGEPGGVPAPLTTGSPMPVQVAGGDTGVPANATSVALSIEALTPPQEGFLQAYTGSTAPPGDIDSTVYPSQSVEEFREIQPDSSGNIKLAYSTLASGTYSTDVAVDIEGYTVGSNARAGNFVPLDPSYQVANAQQTPTTSGQPLAVQVTNQTPSNPLTNVPKTASSVLLDVSTSGSTYGGDDNVRVYPTNSPPPEASLLYARSGVVYTASVVVPIGNNGQVSFSSWNQTGANENVNVTVRIEGYYTNAPALPSTAIDTTPYLGKESYWTFSHSTSVGPESTAAVNVSDGNLDVSASDSTPVQGHGHLAYGLQRTYNSLQGPTGTGLLVQALDDGFTPGTIGQGWTLNLGGFGSGLDASANGGLTSLLSSDWASDTGQSLPPTNQVTLVDEDGTHHVFTLGCSLNCATNLAVTGGAPLGSGLGQLLNDVFASGGPLSAIDSLTSNANICLTQPYQAPPGVHLALWRFDYVNVPGSGTPCQAGSGGAVLQAGYITERPDGLRSIYSATGQLLDQIDRAGTDLHFSYDDSFATNLSTEIANGVAPLPLLGQLRDVYESNVPYCTTGSGGTCRDMHIDYGSSEGCNYDSANTLAAYAVCVKDPAGRTTIYDLDGTPNGITHPVVHLIEVQQPDGSKTYYGYGTGSLAKMDPTSSNPSGIPCAETGFATQGGANQLCGIMDSRGNVTRVAYNSSLYPNAAYGPVVTQILDRRSSPGVDTTFAYTMGQLDAEQDLPQSVGGSSLMGLSSTTEVTVPSGVPSGSGFVACDTQAAIGSGCDVTQYTGLDTAGRVWEVDQGQIAGGANGCAGPNQGGICADAVTTRVWDAQQVSTPSAPSVVLGSIGSGYLSSSMKYWYSVAAVAGSGITADSTETASTCTGPNQGATISWTPVVGATSYRIYRENAGCSSSSPGNPQLLAEVPASQGFSYLDANSSTPSGSAPTSNTTFGKQCSADNIVDEDLCTTTQYAFNDTYTGQTNHIFTPDRTTNYTYGPDGSMLTDDVSMPSSEGPNIDTTYGYRYQYWQTSGGAPNDVEDDPSGNGTTTVTTTQTFSSNLRPGTSGSTTLFILADKVQTLSPDGNAAGSSYSGYLTNYRVDDLDHSGSTPIPPNHLQTPKSQNDASFPNDIDPEDAVVCGTSSNAGTPTSDTGVLCETDTPQPHSAPTETHCQASSAQACTTYTYDGWGELTSKTMPNEHVAGSGYAAYRYVYIRDGGSADSPMKSTSLGGGTNAGGWLAAVVDPEAQPTSFTDATRTVASGSSDPILSATRHFVVFGYDAAGNQVLSWDRLAVQNNYAANSSLSLASYLALTESGGSLSSAASTPVPAHYDLTLYGSHTNSSGDDLIAHPWIYELFNTQPDATSTSTGYMPGAAGSTTNAVDLNGNVTSTTDPDGHVTTHAYDGDDELTATTLQVGANVPAHLISVSDPGDSTAGTTTYTYDTAGNQTGTTDPYGNTSAKIYNNLDELVYVITPRSTSSSDAPDCQNLGTFGFDLSDYVCYTLTTYDGLGDPISVLNGNGTTTYTYYDADGRVIGKSTPYNAATTAPSENNLDGGHTPTQNSVAYLTTIDVLDSDGNNLLTCTPRDFDGIDGSLANTSSESGAGTALPGTSGTLTTLTGDCNGSVPLYGTKTDYDSSDRPVDSYTYQAAPSTADPAWSPSAPSYGTSASGSGLASGSTVVAEQTSTTYDNDGNAIKTTDPDGNVSGGSASTNSTYDSYGPLDELLCTSSPRGANAPSGEDASCVNTPGAPGANTANTVSTTYLYDDSGDQTSITKPPADSITGAGTTNQRITVTQYDDDHRVLDTIADATSTNPGQIGTGFASDPTHQQNLVTGYTYDSAGNVIQQLQPNAYPTSLGGSINNHYSTDISYDADNRPVAIYQPRSDSSVSGTGTPTNQCSSTTAPSNLSGANVCETDLYYDANSNKRVVTLPTQTSSTKVNLVYDYTLDNLQKDVVVPDPSNPSSGTVKTQQTVYDGDDNPLSVADPTGLATDTTYTSDDLPKSITDGTNNEIEDLNYDANGDTVSDAQKVSAGQFQTGDIGAWQATDTSYNSDGSTAKSTAAPADITGVQATVYSYDADQNPIKIVNPNGNPTFDTYTNDGLLASTEKYVLNSSDTRTTTYNYDPAGRKETQTTGESVSGTPSQGGQQAFSYFDNDLPATQNGRVSTSCRLNSASACTNASGAITSSAPTDSDTNSGAIAITNGYDADGNLTTAADNTYGGYGSSTTMSYSLDDLLIGVTEGSYSETVGYDGSRQLTYRQTVANSHTHTTTIANSNAEVPASLTSDGNNWTFSYTAAGKLHTVTYPDSEYLTNTYNYDENLSNTELDKSSGGTRLTKYNYSYDDMNRVTTEVQQIGTGPSTNQNFSYDAYGRICETDTGPSTKTNYTYDADNNRTDIDAATAEASCLNNGVGSSSGRIHYDYNDDDSIKDQVNGSTTTYYDYDAAGRLTYDGTNAYCYDGFDRMSVYTTSGTNSGCATTTANTTQYNYDGLNRQVYSSSNASGSSPHSYGFDAASNDETTDSKGSSGTSDIAYVRNADGTPLAVDQGSSLNQYLTDDGRGNLGTVSGGSPAAEECAYAYDPFGNPAGSCTAGNSYLGSLLYNDGHQDPTSKTYQDGTRTYSPTLAAFTAADSYGPGSGVQDQSIGTDPLTADSYVYVNGDPVNYNDPDGHAQQCIDSDGAHECLQVHTADEKYIAGPVATPQYSRHASSTVAHLIQTVWNGFPIGQNGGTYVLPPLPHAWTFCAGRYTMNALTNGDDLGNSHKAGGNCISIPANTSVSVSVTFDVPTSAPGWPSGTDAPVTVHGRVAYTTLPSSGVKNPTALPVLRSNGIPIGNRLGATLAAIESGPGDAPSDADPYPHADPVGSDSCLVRALSGHALGTLAENFVPGLDEMEGPKWIFRGLVFVGSEDYEQLCDSV